MSVAGTVKRVVRAILPARLTEVIRVSRDLSSRSGAIYRRRALGRAFATIRPRSLLPGNAPVRRVLFVCHGNIIRSASGAEILRSLLHDGDGIDVRSAGTHAINGNTADPRVLAAAGQHRVQLGAHRATHLTAELVHGADLILIMDFKNEADVLAHFPQADDKLRLLGTFRAGPSPHGAEIPDPYTGGADDVAACVLDVERCVVELVARLREQGPRETPPGS